jgi:hypothetical protein
MRELEATVKKSWGRVKSTQEKYGKLHALLNLAGLGLLYHQLRITKERAKGEFE